MISFKAHIESRFNRILDDEYAKLAEISYPLDEAMQFPKWTTTALYLAMQGYEIENVAVVDKETVAALFTRHNELDVYLMTGTNKFKLLSTDDYDHVDDYIDGEDYDSGDSRDWTDRRIDAKS